jgi:hypothetical protein
MLKIVSLLVVLVCSVRGYDPTHYNIDQKVDDLLPTVNGHMDKYSLVNVTLADLSKDGAPVLIGVQLGSLDTMVRSGEAEMWAADQDTLAVKVPVSLKQRVLEVSYCPMVAGPLSMDIGQLVAEVGFSLVSQPDQPDSCTNVYNYIKITSISDLVMHCANPTYDGKAPPADLLELLLPFYNDWLNQPDVLAAAPKYLNLCGPL